ncbi:S-norcoclaurine synthase 1 [Linum perenne]
MLMKNQLSSTLLAKTRNFFRLVINHGVIEEVIQRIKVDVQEFFNLPLQEKMLCAQFPNAIGLEGYGHSFVSSDEHMLRWGTYLVYLVHNNRSLVCPILLFGIKLLTAD